MSLCRGAGRTVSVRLALLQVTGLARCTVMKPAGWARPGVELVQTNRRAYDSHEDYFRYVADARGGGLRVG